jgi:integrase
LDNQAFQAIYAGSIPATRSTENTYDTYDKGAPSRALDGWILLAYRNLFRYLQGMGQKRKPLSLTLEGLSWTVRFKHPLRAGKVVRGSFGQDQKAASGLLVKLNGIFMNPENWEQMPPDTPEEVRRVWLGANTGTKFNSKTFTWDGKVIELTPKAVAPYFAQLDAALRQLSIVQAECRKYSKLLGRKVRSGPSPTLEAARETWLKSCVDWDADHKKIVTNDLKRFVAKFGESTLVDDMEGREHELDVWIRGLTILEGTRKGLPLSAGRKQQIRRNVLQFLTNAGAEINKKAVRRPSKDEVRSDRGPIRWLDREQAVRLAEALPQPWQDLFRVQVSTGMRPDELITLCKDNFTADYATVTLAPLQHLTLKQGPRTISVPVSIREIIKTRLEQNPIVFPDHDGKVWKGPSPYNRMYRRALRSAAKTIGIEFKVDCRLGRRTCGSILLRSGKSLQEVAAILGDRAETVAEHYARILSHEVDPSAASI